MKRKHYAAAAAVLMLVSWEGIQVQAADSVLDEVIVEGERTQVGILPGGYVSTRGDVGLLGNRSVMDVPFTQTNFTAQNIEDFGGPSQAIDNVLVNMPSVTQSGTMLHQDFAIRGQYVDGSSGGFVNGVPGMAGQFTNPTVMAESIELLAGPNKVISSTFPAGERTGAAGMLNFTSKKASVEPITTYRQTFSGKSGLVENMDVGRRFGRENEWGVRINAEISSGNPSEYDGVRKAQSFYANIDHRNERSETNFLIGYQNYKVEGGLRWFSLGSKVTKLPDAPKGSMDYSFDGIEKQTESTFMVLNHKQKINDHWAAFLNAGWTHGNLKKNITGKSSRLTIINDEGDFSGSYFTRRTPSHKYYLQAGTRGDFYIGSVKNDLVIAADKSWSKSFTGVVGGYNLTNFTGPGGNIYTGLDPYGNVNIPNFENYHSSSSQYWGWSIADTLEYGKWQVLVGVHKHNTSYRVFSEKGINTKTTKTDGVCPTYGITYKANDELAVYASHSEFFDAGSIVADGYTNAGSIIDPAKTKQNEAGIKYLKNGLLTTLAFFDNKAASAMGVYVNDNDKLPYYRNDAETEYKGVELSVNGRIADKWNVMGGVMYLDAKRNKTEGGKYDGYKVNGIPDWNAVAAFEYNPNEQMSVIARAVYTGSAPISDEKFEVPSHVTFDLGVKYRTKWADTPVILSAMCYNLTDKDYWIAYGSNLHVSSPRTLMVSAQFNL